MSQRVVSLLFGKAPVRTLPEEVIKLGKSESVC